MQGQKSGKRDVMAAHALLSLHHRDDSDKPTYNSCCGNTERKKAKHSGQQYFIYQDEITVGMTVRLPDDQVYMGCHGTVTDISSSLTVQGRKTTLTVDFLSNKVFTIVDAQSVLVVVKQTKKHDRDDEYTYAKVIVRGPSLVVGQVVTLRIPSYPTCHGVVHTLHPVERMVSVMFYVIRNKTCERTLATVPVQYVSPVHQR